MERLNYSQVSRHKKAHFFRGAGYLVCSQYKASASFGVSILSVPNANLHLMFDKIVIEETDEGLNLDLRLKSPFISKKKEPLLKKYMIVNNEVLSVGA